MKQLVIKKGIAINEEIPAPAVQEGFILIKVAYSCISAGTEMQGVERSKMSLLSRAMEKPEKVRMVLDMLKKRGLIDTYKQVKDLNDVGQPSGYSVSGIVVEVGSDIPEIKPGDRVSAAGGGYAIHADYVLVPKNLVVKIPDDVSLEDASTATIGAIALHGVRRAGLTIGEYGVVVGCGIIGLLSVQILKASGVKVAAVDPDRRRRELAKSFGAEIQIDPTAEDEVMAVRNWSDGMGVDAVLFTAAVSTSKPLANSFRMSRRKGKVVLVGTAPIEINRQDIYNDEIDFLISTSYGPGRYDVQYEEKGIDYPYAYVRWTENRNIKEFLSLIERKAVDIKIITDSIIPFNQSDVAFRSLSESPEKPLIVLLKYDIPDSFTPPPEQTLNHTTRRSRLVNEASTINVAIVGTGNFLRNVHLPNLQLLKDKYRIHAVMSHKGYDCKVIAEQNNASYSTTDYAEILNDKEVDLVFICTRHQSHAGMVLEALQAGKNVFVEKPLATSREELQPIIDFYGATENPPVLMVGFNRRFSQYASEIKKHVDKRVNPLFIRYRMNAGYLKSDHWVFGEGGRIVGEACHIIDLMQFLTGTTIVEVSSTAITPATGHYSSGDNRTITLKFKDGSVASIDYFAVGNSKLSKEYMEVHFDGKSIVMDDYKVLRGYGLKMQGIKTKMSDKGHYNELVCLYNAISNPERYNHSINDSIQNTHVTFIASK